MKTIITISMLTAFLWLAYASQHRQEEGYTHSVFDVLDKQKPRSDRQLLQAQAKALAYLYDLTPEEAAKPINLFGKE